MKDRIVFRIPTVRAITLTLSGTGTFGDFKFKLELANGLYFFSSFNFFLKIPTERWGGGV
jgi:hypothetical protein